MPLKIGVSGKRIINVSDQQHVAKCMETSIRQLLKKHNTESFVGYTSLASGSDTIFAKIVRDVFKMPVNLILPFRIDEYKRDFTEDADISTLINFIETAENIEVASNVISPGKEEREQAYLDAGKRVVDACNEMIFVWDELKPSGKGGTGEIIGYYSENANKIPVNYINLITKKDDLIDLDLTKEYEISNEQAIKSRNSYKLSWTAAIAIGWLAAVLFSINVAFHISGLISLIIACTEFSLVAIVFLIIIRAKRRKYHQNYLSQRLRAEKLRILRYFYYANVPFKVPDLPLSNDKSLSDIVKKINDSILNDAYNSKWYSNYVIKLLIKTQCAYFKNKVGAIGSKYFFFEKLNLIVVILFMLNLVLHVVNKILEYSGQQLTSYIHSTIVFMSILLPATYAAIEGIMYFQEWELLKKYSAAAEDKLKEKLEELPDLKKDSDDDSCFKRQAITLNSISNILLTDNRDWHLILENKHNYHWVL